ncbi:hypothetical protein MAR_024493 [Mya arenaria]|uniref:SWIM-type domain-containing protein n=1 Tax=Mya arenaria TaxID=6604 RepID=A0ABY7DUX9_MYAAR|nr:uncharacterized protein LOC128229303 [Mya arenaria]WAR00121.1 hypothetical protein MAR_024493 [Mya arenaria]
MENYLQFDLETLHNLTCKQLKELLRTHDESVSASKASLVSRLFAVISKERQKTKPGSENVDDCLVGKVDINIPENCAFSDLIVLADTSEWSSDLRHLPIHNFHQLYEYLVQETSKYGAIVLKGTNYKRERAYQFHNENHISDMKIAKNKDVTLAKCKVIASMKKCRYKVVVVFSEIGDVMYAACECPAGLGLHGAGKCNHIGGLLFRVEEFTRKELQKALDTLTCTSKLSNWNVPRDLQIPAAPLAELKIYRNQPGKQTGGRLTVTSYDPRAPQDRFMDHAAFHNLQKELEDCMPASGFFLFHKQEEIQEEDSIVTDDSFVLGQHVEVGTSFCLDDSVKAKLSDEHLMQKFGCNEHIYEENVSQAVNQYPERTRVENDIIDEVEKRTRAQNQSSLWKDLHKVKLTASNFGKCKSSPVSILKQIFHCDVFTVAMQYGHKHEQNAIYKCL